MKTHDAPDIPPTLFVTLLVIGTFFFLFLTWIFSYAVLSQVTDKFQAKSETGMANETRLKYIQKENDFLNSAAKLDNGTRKMSIEQAMDEVIQKANK